MNPYLDSFPSKQQEADVSIKDVESYYDVQTNGKKQTFACKLPDCGKTFKYKSEIVRHIATHSNFRPFACPIEGCKKGFKRADALENHVRTHTKETPFVCSVSDCGMSFPTKASLRYHVLKHKDQKIYKCNFPGCTKSFITVFQLKQHEKSACIHKKLKTADGDEIVLPPQDNGDRVRTVPDMEKEIVISSARPKMNEPELKTPLPIYEMPQQGPLQNQVRNILTENQLLKKKLEFSHKIISMLQQKNEVPVMPYIQNSEDYIPENPPFFFRPSMFQGQIFE